jgi:hypothetical protein
MVTKIFHNFKQHKDLRGCDIEGGFSHERFSDRMTSQDTHNVNEQSELS